MPGRMRVTAKLALGTTPTSYIIFAHLHPNEYLNILMILGKFGPRYLLRQTEFSI